MGANCWVLCSLVYTMVCFGCVFETTNATPTTMEMSTIPPLSCEDREINVSVNAPVARSIPIVLICKTIKMGDNPCITTSRSDPFNLRFVKANDGEIIMLLTYLLHKYDNKNTYTSTFDVGCGDKNTIATITIHEMDLNDAPILNNMRHTVMEGQVGQWRIPIIDPDAAMPHPSVNTAWKELTIQSIGMPRQFHIMKRSQTHFLLKLRSPLYAKDPRWISNQRGTTTNCTLLTEHGSLTDFYGQFQSPKVDFTLRVQDGGGLAANGSVRIEIVEANNSLPFCDPVLLRNESREKAELHQCKPIVGLFTCCQNPDLCTGCQLDFRYLGNRECQQVFQMYSNFHEHVVQLTPCPEHTQSNKAICTVALQDRYTHSLSPVIFEVKLSECPAEIDQYNVMWEKGLPGQYMQRNCSSGFSGRVFRLCGTDGVYQPPFYNCTSAKLRILAQEVGYKNFNVSHILDDLSSATTTNATYQPLFAGDMETVAAIMATITERVKTDGRVNTNQINNYLETANNVMEEWNKDTWKSLVEKTGIGVDRVLNNIDNFIQVDMTMNRSTDLEKSYSKSNLYLSIGRFGNFQYNLTFPNRQSDNIPLWAKDATDNIVISFEKDQEDRVYSAAMYRDLREMIPYWMAPDQQRLKESLNSRVMAMTLLPKRDFLEKRVTITFETFKRGVNHKPKCSYWNTGQDIGYWSTDGCALVSYDADRGIVVCECNHLTNFAILMSQTIATAEHTKTLSMLSLIGCIISTIFLVVTVAVHLKYWRHVDREQTTVLMNLCISLFLGYVAFLSGVDKVTDKAVCTIVAVLLHFIYIVVFFTMLANGVLLAKAVLTPFNKTPIAKWSLLASYGGACIVVGISTAVTQLDGYGSSSSCWLSVDSRLIWTFIVPVLVVCLINMVIIVIAMRKMYGTAVMSQKSIRDKATIGLRNISILLPTLGVTWAFGVLSVNEDTVVFQYLFCIFNSLQGLVIFIFHCILNKKIKKAFLRSFKMDQSHDTTSSDKDKITHRTTSGDNVI